MATVTELVTKFSFVGSTAPLGEFNKGLGSAIKGISAVSVAIGAATAAFGGYISGVLGSLDPMIQLSRTTGVSVEAIQELGFAASVTGSSAQAMQGTLLRLTRRAGEAAQGMGEGVKAFEALGIKVKDANGDLKTADVLLLEINAAAERLNLTNKDILGFSEKLGIDPTVVQLINQSTVATDKLRQKARDLGIITTAQADDTAAYNDALTTLRFGMAGVRNIIAVSLAPALQNIADIFTDLLIANRDWIIDGVTRTTEIVGVLLSSIQRLAPVLVAIGAAFTIAKIATINFGKVLLFIKAPAFLIAAAILGILAIVDDLIVAFRGGQSFIADFFQEFLGVDIRPYLQGIYDLALLLIDAFAMWLKGIVEVFKVLRQVISIVGGAAFDRVSSLISRARGIFDSDTTAMQPSFMLGNGTGGIGGAINNNLTQDVNVNIMTSDPILAGERVRESLTQNLDNAQRQLNRGGR